MILAALLVSSAFAGALDQHALVLPPVSSTESMPVTKTRADVTELKCTMTEVAMNTGKPTVHTETSTYLNTCTKSADGMAEHCLSERITNDPAEASIDFFTEQTEVLSNGNLKVLSTGYSKWAQRTSKGVFWQESDNTPNTAYYSVKGNVKSLLYIESGNQRIDIAYDRTAYDQVDGSVLYVYHYTRVGPAAEMRDVIKRNRICTEKTLR